MFDLNCDIASSDGVCSTMPFVNVCQGQLSSLVFTDSSNKVWPIVSYSIGSPETFKVTDAKEAGILMIQASKLYGQTNMAVILKGCLLYTSPSPRDKRQSRMPSSA